MPACPEKFADIAAALGGDVYGLSATEAAEVAVGIVEKLSKDVGIPEYLDDIGVFKSDLDKLVQKALDDKCMLTNPRPADRKDMEKLYLSKFK